MDARLTSCKRDTLIFDEQLDEVQHSRELGEHYRFLPSGFSAFVLAGVDLLKQLEQFANFGGVRRQIRVFRFRQRFAISPPRKLDAALAMMTILGHVLYG